MLISRHSEKSFTVISLFENTRGNIKIIFFSATCTNTNGMEGTNADLSSGTTRAHQPLMDYLEECPQLQQYLLLLLNAVQCKRSQQTNVESCSLPDCKIMKNALYHMKTCNAGRSCEGNYE